jgi:hypothetical protein
MLIGNKYKVESDSLNVTLFQKGVSKSNEVYWRPIGYFSSLENALDHLVDLEVMETELKDLRAVVEKQKELCQLIKGLGQAPNVVERVRH